LDLALAVESLYFTNILCFNKTMATIRSLFISMGEFNEDSRSPADTATKISRRSA